MARQSETAQISHYFSPQLHQSTAPFPHFVQHGDTGYTARIIGQDPSSGALAALPLGARVQIDATVAVDTGTGDDEV